MKMPAQYPVTCHTDQVEPGTTFVVIRGFNHNGTAHIETALKKGAITIIVDQELSPSLLQRIVAAGAHSERVADARIALAQLSARASGYAHKKLKIIGITGTKGKTTTAHILFHLLKTAQINTALISTVGNAIGATHFPPSLTTPQPDYLHQFFQLAVREKVAWVVMEVAAQAISLHRIEGLQFDSIIMTNVAREHLEFYDSLQSYYAAKKKLLGYRTPGAPAWINADDAWLSRIKADNTRWFSCTKEAALSGSLHPTTDFTLSAEVQYKSKKYPIACPTLAGQYNLSNSVAAIGGALCAGLSFDIIKKGMASFPGISGRQEQIMLPNDACAFIDYAHNPLSYTVFLETIAPRTDYLIVLFGAGGERDAGRRPEMGAIVAQYADVIIITTDNPRHENPEAIVADIIRGIPAEQRDAVICEPDRKKAIERAYSFSHKGSIIALLGKGPDEYQLMGDQKIPFSERAVLYAL